MTSLYFDNGLTYYHYGLRNDSSGLFHSTHSEYRSDDHIYQKSPDDMYLTLLAIFLVQDVGSLLYCAQ